MRSKYEKVKISPAIVSSPCMIKYTPNPMTKNREIPTNTPVIISEADHQREVNFCKRSASEISCTNLERKISSSRRIFPSCILEKKFPIWPNASVQRLLFSSCGLSVLRAIQKPTIAINGNIASAKIVIFQLKYSIIVSATINDIITFTNVKKKKNTTRKKASIPRSKSL